MDLSRCVNMTAHTKMMVQDGIDAVTGAEMWDWLKTYEPEEARGFMFTDHPNLKKISDRMYGGHSGSSYGWTMRQLQFIAKNGFDEFVDLVNNDSRPPQRAPTPAPRPVSPIMNRANTGGALEFVDPMSIMSEQQNTGGTMPRRVCMCRSREGFTEGWCSFASMGQVPGCEY